MSRLKYEKKCLICLEKYKVMVPLQQCLKECDELSVAQVLQHLHFLPGLDAENHCQPLCCICTAKVQSCYDFKMKCSQVETKLKTVTDGSFYETITDPISSPFNNTKEEHSFGIVNSKICKEYSSENESFENSYTVDTAEVSARTSVATTEETQSQEYKDSYKGKHLQEKIGSIKQRKQSNCKMMRPSKKRSFVWNYFISDSEKRNITCTKCNKSYKFSGNTTNLKEHLRRNHSYIHVQDDTIKPLVNSEKSITMQSSTISVNTLNPPRDEPPLSNIILPLPNIILPVKRKREQSVSAINDENNSELTNNQIHDLDKSVVEMIVLDYQPLRLVEDKGFTRFCQKLNPKYTLPSKKTLSTTLIPQHYNEIRSKILRDLEHIDHISATTDYWQPDNQKSYITLTIHYINNDYKLISTVLDTREVTASNTSANTGEVLKSIFHEYGIFDKIITVVTDNAASIKNVVLTELHKYHYACIAHTLNHLVNEVISNSTELSRILLKCRGIIGHFKHNMLATNKLREKQLLLGVPNLKPKQDVPISWTSIYTMLERLLELKQPLSVALTELTSNSTPENLSGVEWTIIADCVIVLKALLRIIEELSSEKFVTISKIVPLIRSLQHKLRVLPIPTQIGKDLKGTLLDVVSGHFASLETTEVVAKATFLDPRFKKAGFGTEENANNAQQLVTDELITLLSRGEQIQQNSMNTTNTLSLEPDEDDPWIHFDREISQLTARSQPTVTAVAMVKQYVESQLLPRKENPLLYWQSHERIFPELAKLALKYLSIPANSVPLERLFSKTGLTLNARRNMLKPNKLNEIVFLNTNMFIDDITLDEINN